MSQCPVSALHLGELQEEEPESVVEPEGEVYEADDQLIDEYEGEEEEPESENQLGVVRCILTQTPVKEDWHRTSILQTFVKVGGKVLKIIIDSGSCVNAISAKIVKSLGLTTVPHPSPYKVSWIDSTSIQIQVRCQILIRLQTYEEKIWCDVISMEVSSILGRPWLFDHDATLYGRTNVCAFNYHGNKFVINPAPPRDPVKRGSSSHKDKKLGVSLIKARELEKEIVEGNPVWILTSKEILEQTQKEHPKEIVEALKKFEDVFPEDLPDQLPPLRDIQHTIDLIPGATLPNLPHYRLNPSEHQELQKQVGELLRKGFH